MSKPFCICDDDDGETFRNNIIYSSIICIMYVPTEYYNRVVALELYYVTRVRSSILVLLSF